MRRIAVILCAGLLLVVASPALAGPTRSLRGSTTGTSISDATAAPTVTSVTTGTGTTSHLGMTANSLTTTQDWSGYTSTFPCGVITAGALTMTAANGDTITGTATGGSVCEANPPAGTDYVSTVFVSITGGTGRFADAAGSLELQGTSTLTGSSFADTGSLTGSISY